MSFSRWRPGHTARLLHQQAQFAKDAIASLREDTPSLR